MPGAAIVPPTADCGRGTLQITTPTYIAVDGGASGTRIRVTNVDWTADLTAGPTSLTFAGPAAWTVIQDALAGVEGRVGLIEDTHFGIGIAGAGGAEPRTAFLAAAPKAAAIHLATDAYTSVLGAHGGAPGAVVAVGTGSVGCRLLADGTARLVGGWGFPAGDEGSGAWLGRRALAHTLRVLDGDGVAAPGLTQSVVAQCGSGRDAILAWLKGATSSRFAELAPAVMALAAANDAGAVELALAAGFEIDRLAVAMDPARQVPLSIIGGLAEPLAPYLPEELTQWAQAPKGNALDGAMLLARGDAPPEQLAP